MPRTSFKLNSKIADVGLAISVSNTVDSALLCSPARRFCELQVNKPDKSLDLRAHQIPLSMLSEHTSFRQRQTRSSAVLPSLRWYISYVIHRLKCYEHSYHRDILDARIDEKRI